MHVGSMALRYGADPFPNATLLTGRARAPSVVAAPHPGFFEVFFLDPKTPAATPSLGFLRGYRTLVFS